MKRAEAEKIVSSRGWLAGESRSFQLSLLEHAELKQLAQDQFVFHTGDDPGGIYGIVSGVFAIYLPLPSIGEQLAQIVGPGVWFGQGPMNLRHTRKMTFRAVQNATLFRVPLTVINELVATNPACLRSFGKLTEMNLDLAATAVRDLLIRQADRRIAATLLRVATTTVGARSDASPEFVLSQTELGEMANASRGLVSKALAQFEKQGWISRGYSHIAIRSWQALANFAHDGHDSKTEQIPES